LLPWWTTAAVGGAFEKADEDLANRIQEALNVWLNSNSLGEIQGDAGELKDIRISSIVSERNREATLRR